MRKALEDGMADAWATFKEFKETQLDTGKKSSSDAFGTRAFLNGNYLDRMAGAVLGIYGNSKDEAIYPAYFVDANKQKLEGSNRYTMRFAPGQLPPVNAFWSLTMYELPASLLYANPLNRYLINSPDAAKPETRRGWRHHVVRPERIPRHRQGIELAAGSEGAVLCSDAALLAKAGCAERQVEGSAPATREWLVTGERDNDENHNVCLCFCSYLRVDRHSPRAKRDPRHG